METLLHHHEQLAVLIARIFLGLLFFFQGFDAVFKVGVKNVIAAYERSFASKGIPRLFTVAGSVFTSYAELVCGFLLIFGLFGYPCMALLGADLIIASVAFGISRPMWDMRFVFPRLVLLLFLLLVPVSWNIFSADHFLFKH